MTVGTKHDTIYVNSGKGVVFIRRKNKEKAEVSKYNPVPLYRSYGVTRKEYPFIEKLSVFLQKSLLVTFFALEGVVILLTTIALTLYGSPLMKTAFWLAAGSVIVGITTRKLRAHLRFRAKAKRLCKKENYHLHFGCKLLESLKYSPSRYDAIIETPSRVYYVHTLTITRRNQRLLLDSASRVDLITPPIWKFLAKYLDAKTKTTPLELDLPQIEGMNGKEAVRILLVLPSCEDISYRKSAATIIPTGNGAEHFGFTLFNEKGFLKFLPRFEQNAQSK